jgi:GNAT superfamily N-acetyltransferase
MIATDETRPQVIVAEADAVVGFAALSIWRAFAERAWVCRLSAITVDCSARRSGIGRALMENVEARARRAGCELMELSTGRRPERQAAHKFYQSLGIVDRVVDHAGTSISLAVPLPRYAELGATMRRLSR